MSSPNGSPTASPSAAVPISSPSASPAPFLPSSPPLFSSPSPSSLSPPLASNISSLSSSPVPAQSPLPSSALSSNSSSPSVPAPFPPPSSYSPSFSPSPPSIPSPAPPSSSLSGALPPHALVSPASQSSSLTPTSTSTSTAMPSSSSSSTLSSQLSEMELIGISASGVLAISIIMILLYCICCRRKKTYYSADYYEPPPYKDPYHMDNMGQQQWSLPSSTDSLIKMTPLLPASSSMSSSKNGYDHVPTGGPRGGITNSKSWFTYDELAAATDGFSRSRVLGQGGFGSVYKGVLPRGQLVAVKQLKPGGSQGEKEFQAEVEIISRVHHRHLVSLVGYCIVENQRLLVYDYVPNGTLEHHLHGMKQGPPMNWPTRLKIACGAARGLAYLHEDCHPRIIHRDIKSSNILLDENFEAQVSDFGLAKPTSDIHTHVTTRVMGTFGYLAPEYASSGKLTEKSDVFSFGVVLLELVTGRKPVDQSRPQGEESLVEWARMVLKQRVNGEEDLDQLADPALNRAFDGPEMMRMAEVAAACVRQSANKRPKMCQVVRALEDDDAISDISKGLKPGHSAFYGTSFAGSDHENRENMSYAAELRRFRKVALESQEFGSEYSGATSEYGVNPSSSSEYNYSRDIERTLGRE